MSMMEELKAFGDGCSISVLVSFESSRYTTSPLVSASTTCVLVHDDDSTSIPGGGFQSKVFNGSSSSE